MTDEKFLKALGLKVRDLRKAKKMTQIDLAKKIHVESPMVGRIERGLTNCTINTLRRLAKALQVNTVELINVE